MFFLPDFADKAVTHSNTSLVSSQLSVVSSQLIGLLLTSQVDSAATEVIEIASHVTLTANEVT